MLNEGHDHTNLRRITDVFVTLMIFELPPLGLFMMFAYTKWPIGLKLIYLFVGITTTFAYIIFLYSYLNTPHSIPVPPSTP